MGVTGGRLDHFMGAIAVLEYAMENRAEAVIIDEMNKVRMLRGPGTVKLSDDEYRFFSIVSLDRAIKKAAEKKRADDVIRSIAESDDPLLRYKTGRAITDIKQMFETSVELYGDRPAFRQKFARGESYSVITYKQALADVNGLGTALINRGLKGR